MSRCIACNNTKSTVVESPLEGDALDMFNFVCCLELSEPEESQGICKECHEELRVSFNFKKRCLEIFANVFDEPTADLQQHNDDEEDFPCLDSLLAQSLHEDENSLNLNDLLIPEVCLGNTALSMLDVSDNTKCRYCFNEFSSKQECVSHMESHKGDDKPYKCPQEGCHSSFKARKNLKDHYLVHSNERPFPCHFCEQTFKSSSNRSKHERRIHAKERNAMRSAANQQQLNKVAANVTEVVPSPPVMSVKVKKEPPAVLNTSTDDDERTFKCDHEGCLSGFKTRSSLRDHQKVHSDHRPYNCAFCSSAFKSSSNRSKHERGSHTQQYQKRKLDRENQRNGDVDEEPAAKKAKVTPIQQPSPKVIKLEQAVSPKKQVSTDFPCRYCDRVFKRADSRDKHETTHKDFNAFDCGFCSKNFKTQEALRAHTKTHTEPAKLSCSHPGCTEVYQDRRSLKEHESSHISGSELDYVCDEDNCGKTYTSPKALRNHKRMKHEDDDISCDICATSFKKSALAEHLAKHI